MTAIDTHASTVTTVTTPTGVGRSLAAAAEWITTTDHKKVGRLFIGAALLVLLAVSAVGVILGLERADTGNALVDAGALPQLFASYRVGLTFGVLAPLMLGIGVAIVPLQVGARSLAFPRLAAAGFWAWLLGLVLVVISIANNGGPGGGDTKMVELFLSAHIVLALGLLAAAISVATTLLTTRAPGMNMRRIPLFSWSVLISALGLIVVLPVLIGALAYTYLNYRYGRQGFGGNEGITSWIGFAFRQPVTFVYALPVFGLAAETMAVAGRKRMPMRGVLFAGLGLIGVAAFGGVTQNVSSIRVNIANASFGQALSDGLPYLLFNALPVLGALVVLGISGLALKGRPRVNPAVVFAFLGAAMVFTGMLGNLIFRIGDARLAGTVFEEGAWLYVAYGAVLSGFGAIIYWAPKWSGRMLPTKQVAPLALLGIGGVVLSALPLYIAGFAKQPAEAVQFSYSGPQSTWNLLSTIGHIMMLLTVLAFIPLALRSSRSGSAAGDDPWDGHTLEWATSSPAPEANFADVHVVMSAEPLLDLKPRSVD